MATDVFGSALHPLQGCGCSACKYYCTQHFKDSKSSAPRDRNNKHEILGSVGRVVLLADAASPQLLGFVRVAEAILNVNG